MLRDWFNQPIEASLFLGCAMRHVLPGLCSVWAGENRNHLENRIGPPSFFIKISPLIFKNSKDTICFPHLKFSLNELIISPQIQRLLPLISSLISKAIWMLGLGEERLGAVILGIERRCGINVPDMMKRTLNDIFGGISIMVAGTCKKEKK